MGYIFDENLALQQEQWLKTEAGRAARKVQTDLFFRLVKPLPSERILDIGCGAGYHLVKFSEMGFNATGVEPSEAMLSLARSQVGARAGLKKGLAEDLPFEDNEFDIAVFIFSLEYIDDPEKALAEAFRVTKSRIFISVWNRYSLSGFYQKGRSLVQAGLFYRASFFSLLKLKRMLGDITDPKGITWAGATPLYPGLTTKFEAVSSRIGLSSNPFGCILGIRANISYSLRTEGLPLKASLKIKGQTVPGSTAGMGMADNKKAKDPDV